MFTSKFFTCNQVGNQSFRYPKKNKQGDRRIQLTQEEDSQSVTSYQYATSKPIPPEHGESLMMQRTMLKAPAPAEPPQRKSLFKTYCKVNNKVCRVIKNTKNREREWLWTRERMGSGHSNFETSSK